MQYTCICIHKLVCLVMYSFFINSYSACETLIISRRSPRFRHLVSALDCHQSKRRCSCKSLQAWFSNSHWLRQMTCSSLEFIVLSSSVLRASTSVWNGVDSIPIWKSEKTQKLISLWCQGIWFFIDIVSLFGVVLIYSLCCVIVCSKNQGKHL